jgi:hypothetical protein
VKPQTAQVDDLRLVALPSAVKCTDLFVRFSLTEWSLPDLLDDASSAAQRLVRAVVENTDEHSPGFVTVRLRLSGDCLVVEVEDDQVANAHDDAPVVEGRQTGAVPLEGRGKLVWCEVPLPAGVNAQGVRLPRRDERRRAPLPETATGESRGPDPDLVDRVLVGLRNREW